MNREIKFRAISLRTGKWVYGLPLRLVQDDDRINGIQLDDLENIDVDPETVCEYCGTCDTKGRKIYEGDILREKSKSAWEDTNFMAYEVFFHDNDSADRHIGFQLNRIHCYGAIAGGEIIPTLLPKWANKMTIIGNIFDNPELVKR